MSLITNKHFRTLIKVGIFSLFVLGPASTFASASETCPEESQLIGNICVTDLSDPTGDVPGIDANDPNQLITLRMAVTAINESATPTSATKSIYFDLALFNGNASESSIALSSPLEIRSNVQIVAPVAADSSILLTITRSQEMETAVALIVVNPDSPAALTNDDLSNREVIIENIKIDSSADSSNVLVTSGRAIEVKQSDSPTGIFSSGPTLVLKNVIVENSVAEGDGGAINSESDVRVEGSTFRNNTSIGSGGAIYAQETITITQSVFESNTALRPIGSNPMNENGPEGGAIYGEENVTVISSSFTSNRAEIGGAISADEVDISSSTFSRNEATLVVEGNPNFFGIGGAISLVGTGETSTIHATNFIENTAGMGGAIQISPMSDAVLVTTLVITESTFTSNEAQAPENYARGGAIVAPFTASIEVKYTDFISNVSATDGGAIAIEGGFIPSPDENFRSGLSIENTHFVGNRAGLDGGAIHINTILPSEVNIRYDVSIISSPIGEHIEPENRNPGTVFSANEAVNFGGAIYASTVSGDFKINKVTFEENEALDGGAIYIDETPIFGWNLDEWMLIDIDPNLVVELWKFNTIEIESSLFLRNSAQFSGGAIAADDAVIVRGSRFEENSATESGGAIEASRVEIERSTFIRNFACSSGSPWDPEMTNCPDADLGWGGAIAIDSSFNEFFGGILMDFQAGAEIVEQIDSQTASLLVQSLQLPSTISSSYFSDNVAGSQGGALWGYAWLFFNTFLNNRAEVGSSISLAKSTYNVESDTLEISPQNLFSQAIGNFFFSEHVDENQCAVPFHFSLINQMTDSSCALMEEVITPILRQEFNIGIDISSSFTDLNQFGDEPQPSSLLAAEDMSNLEMRYRESLADFLGNALSSNNEGVSGSFGLVVSVASLIFDLTEFLTPSDPNQSDVLDDSNLNLMIDSIFGPFGSPAGLKVDLMGLGRPSTGCWTFGAIQSQEGINCGDSNDVVEVDGSIEKSQVVAVARASSGFSTWKPRVPTQRDLDRKARLAALKAKIMEIRKNRVMKKAVLLENARNRFKVSKSGPIGR